MNCLFWNTNNKKINQYIANAVLDNKIDLLVLAEYKDDKNQLLSMLSDKGYNLYYVPQIGCTRIHIFTYCKPAQVVHMNETGYYTLKRIPHSRLGLLTFAFVHFPSKKYMDDIDFDEEARKFKEDVEDAEGKCNSTLTVLTGDFNMNPFEKGMMMSSAIHAFPTKSEASKVSRVIKDRTYNMFYNPMWSFLGDGNTPQGTYHYTSSHHRTLFWNIFDQVLVRPSLIENISPEDINILTDIQGQTLLNRNGKPKVSDHLPLFFRIT